MSMSTPTVLFLLGKDYHLGDLLWFTAVLKAYRRHIPPQQVLVGCPDRPISRILEYNPLIDELLYGDAGTIKAEQRQRFGDRLVVYDLHILALAMAMMRDWRYRLPWLYYRDLWCQPRGQWLATFLHLGPLQDFRPVLVLTDEDRTLARTLSNRSVVLAPHIGHYTLPFAGALWRRIKGWEWERWITLARLLRQHGYEPITLAAHGQEAIPGTTPLIGLPIRQAAGAVERAGALITAESGLWFVAAALGTPFVIVPWWLPRSINWPAAMNVPHRLVYRHEASVQHVLAQVYELMGEHRPPPEIPTRGTGT
jgi:hypothetical protein